MEKSYSEKVARIFEIGCYFMIVPAVFGLLYSVFSIILVIPVAIIFALGVLLFSCYADHSRGTLELNKVRIMWFSTILFNGLFSVPTVYSFANKIYEKGNLGFQEYNSGASVIWLTAFFTIVAWQIVATILPVTALISINRTCNLR